MEPTTKKCKKRKLKLKTGMLRSIGKQSGESVESVPKKKRKPTVGRICRKVFLKPGMKVRGDRILIIIRVMLAA